MAQEWWVPLTAAGVGAFSALIINWLTRKSERKRDDTRWEREAVDRKAEREHEFRLHESKMEADRVAAWRTERQLAYVALLSAYDAWTSALRRWTISNHLGPEPDFAEIDSASKAFATNAEVIDLMGTSAVRAAVNTIEQLRLQLSIDMIAKAFGTSNVMDERVADINANAGKLKADVRRAMRADLGIE